MRLSEQSSAVSQRWSAVDHYFAALLAPSDFALDAALADKAAASLPVHGVSAVQGKMLALFVRMAGARRVLDLGMLVATTRSGWRGLSQGEGRL